MKQVHIYKESHPRRRHYDESNDEQSYPSVTTARITGKLAILSHIDETLEENALGDSVPDPEEDLDELPEAA